MNKTVKNTIYALKSIWEIDKSYVILNTLYTFENIPRRLLNVLIMKYIVDAATGGESFGKILAMGLMFLTFQILLTVIKHLFNHVYKIPHEEIIRMKMKKQMMSKVVDMDLSCYDDSQFYDSYTKSFSALDNVSFTALNTLTALLGAILSTATLASYIFLVDPVIILVSLIGSAVSILSNSVLSKVSYSEKVKQTSPMRVGNYVQDKFFGRNSAKDLKLEKLPEMLISMYDKAFEEKIEVIKSHERKKFGLKVLFESPLDMSDMFMWLYIAYGITKGVFQAGDFISMSNAVWSLSQQLRNIFNNIPKLQENALFVDDIIVFNENKPKIFSGKAEVSDENSHTLTVTGLSFGYKGDSEILSDISFEISTGQRLAIVGHNGAGKTTLIKLLLRLYDPTSGTVKLDGKPYSEYDLESLRGQFAVVFQDYQYYAMSVAENILMRTPKNEQDELIVLDAMKKVGLYEKISAFENGIHTKLTQEFDKKGEVFSGGEYQRLAIARAIVKNTPILIMDEPSSALDPLVEKEISDLITENFKDRIVIIISHKLSMTKNSDKIVLLDKGKIKELGTHFELLDNNGLYAKLWAAQAESYI